MPSAYIDLKNCQFFLRSGRTGTSGATGLVNNAGGYAIGATTMLVDAITLAVANGDTFTLDGHATIYTITAHIETTGATTSVTFTPALKSAVLDNDPFTIEGPTLEVTIGDGNLTYDEKRDLEYKKNRGKLDVVRLGEENPVDVNFQFAWTYLSSASGELVPTVEDALLKTGVASTWKSSSSVACEPYAVDLIILNTPVDCGAAVKPIERVTLPDFRHTSLAHDPKAGTVTCQGTSNVIVAVKDRLVV